MKLYELKPRQKFKIVGEGDRIWEFFMVTGGSQIYCFDNIHQCLALKSSTEVIPIAPKKPSETRIDVGQGAHIFDRERRERIMWNYVDSKDFTVALQGIRWVEKCDTLYNSTTECLSVTVAYKNHEKRHKFNDRKERDDFYKAICEGLKAHQ